MCGLASIFQQQGRLERAEELLIIVLEKQRKQFGGDHPHTRWTIEELANLYRRIGELQAARNWKDSSEVTQSSLHFDV
jgi:hypothetical protein